MRHFALLAVTTAFCLPHVAAAQTAAAVNPTGCAPQGDVKFICGLKRPEDVFRIPGTDFIVASALDGGLNLISVRDRTTAPLYPSATAKEALDKGAYPACLGAPDAEDKAKFITAGITVQPRPDGAYRLYAVHLGKRTSVEVFDLDVHPKIPRATWIGCVLAPETVSLNSVVALPGDGLIATNFYTRGAEMQASRAKMMAGEINGDVLEWHPETGWAKAPGSESSGANGVEVSKDGKWLYIDQWGSRSFMRLSRGDAHPQRDVIPLDFRIDNIHWAPDGMVLAGGQGEKTTRIVKIDPKTLKATDLITQPDTDAFAGGTGAALVGDGIWVGSHITDRIAIFPANK